MGMISAVRTQASEFSIILTDACQVSLGSTIRALSCWYAGARMYADHNSTRVDLVDCDIDIRGHGIHGSPWWGFFSFLFKVLQY
jgi:hypothetical protein